jgi:hypothetical protein
MWTMIIVDTIDMDYVIMCGGQRLNRPSHVARSYWLWYWEDFCHGQENKR